VSRCEECGFDWSADDREVLLQALAVQPDGLVAREPHLRCQAVARRWSALEYAAHMSDALAFYLHRIVRMCSEDRPDLGLFDPDIVALGAGYAYRDPGLAVRDFRAAAQHFVGEVGALPPAALSRRGLGIDGNERTVLQMLQRAVHEGHHHLLDIDVIISGAIGAG
jgi:hypothetical protein